MKESGKMVLIWQIDLSKWKEREDGKNWRTESGGDCTGEELREERIKREEDKYLNQREWKPLAVDKKGKNRVCAMNILYCAHHDPETKSASVHISVG